LTAEDRLFADLAALGIAYQLVEHEAVFTVEESARLDREIPGAHTKNLFLKDAGGRFWLITVPAEIRVDLKKLPQAIESKRLSFGSADDMTRLLGISPGSVTPLAAINDHRRLVTIVIEASLSEAKQVNVHPLRNDATIGLKPDDLSRLLGHWDHAPVLAEIPDVAGTT
jgi:Ala-tRNA(Pro) deacylase